jgi:hypothetical protein
MFTEHSLRDYPHLVKALTGIEAVQFWALIQQLTEYMEALPVSAGRPCDLPLAIRVAIVLTYLRLHIPQATVAALFGATQSDVSRDLRRLLPLIQPVLPCPQVWEVQEASAPVTEHEHLALEQLADGRVLVDATEQRVARPSQRADQKAYYSGKKKQFTLKTQIVADSAHYIHAMSEAVPGAEHDKALSDRLHTLDRLPTECEAAADKGYQGLAAQVPYVPVRDTVSGATAIVPRLTVYTPIKKPKGGVLTEEQMTFNRVLSAVRIRVEHCIGWVKNWAILTTRFRCAHSLYTSIMCTICGFVNAQTQRRQTAKDNCA